MNVVWNQVEVIPSVVDGTRKRKGTPSCDPSTTFASNENSCMMVYLKKKGGPGVRFSHGPKYEVIFD